MKWQFWIALVLAGAASMAEATPLDTIGTFCGTFPSACRNGTESLMAVRGTGTNAYYVLEADVTTGALPVNVTGGSITATFASVGLTGAAVPTSADYTGLNVAGNLIGAVGDSSGRTIVVGAGTAGAGVGGVLSVQGVASGVALPISAAALPLPSGASTEATLALLPLAQASTTSGQSGPLIQGAVTTSAPTYTTAKTNPLSLTTGGLLRVDVSGASGATNVSQFGGNNVVTGTGTGGNGIPRVTVSSDSTVGLVAGSAIIGNVRIDQTTPGTTNAVAATNFPTTADVNAGLVGASTIRVVRGGAASTTTVVASNAYSGTNVTTSAYVQLIASTANATNTVCVSNTNAANLKIATGAGGAEVDRIYLTGGGSGCYDINVPASTRISLKSIDVTASTGYFLYTGY